MGTRLLIAVTGSDRPYVFDLPQVLSLPPGFDFRFRYRVDWIAAEVLDELSRTKGGLEGTDLWLYFHSRQTQRLLPLRRCTVVRLERLGPVYFLRFRVGEFPDWKRFPRPAPPSADKHDRSTCPRCRQADAASLAARELILGDQQDRSLELELPKGCYLRFGANDGGAFGWNATHDSAERALRVAEDWGDSIELLAHEENELHGVPLFYLLGFQGADDAWLSAGPLHDEGTALASHGYELVQGERYRMRVIEWRQDRSVNSLIKIDCVFNAEVLRLEGSWSMVVGKYDVPEFTFNALKRGYSEVAIATERLPPVIAVSNTRSPATTAGVKDHATDQGEDTEGERPAPSETQTEQRAEWPSYYSARVPVKVKFGAKNVGKVGGLSALGLLSFALPQLWSGVSSGVAKSGVELFGLFLLMLAGGKFAKDYASFSGSIYRFPGLGGGPPGSQG